jgi:hypothetical protein
MANHRNRFPARRRFLKQSTALTATVVALPLPSLGQAEPAAQQDAASGKREALQPRRRGAKR